MSAVACGGSSSPAISACPQATLCRKALAVHFGSASCEPPDGHRIRCRFETMNSEREARSRRQVVVLRTRIVAGSSLPFAMTIV